LAEFGIAVEVFNDVEVCVADCIGGADVGAGKTGYAILGMLYHTEAFFHIQLEDLGRADVDTELTSPA
jgi:hypothetical protein